MKIYIGNGHLVTQFISTIVITEFTDYENKVSEVFYLLFHVCMKLVNDFSLNSFFSHTIATSHFSVFNDHG